MRNKAEKLSQFLYRKLYNRYKYIQFVDFPPIHALLYPIYALFNIFYFRNVLKFYKKFIDKVSCETQLFFIGRRDFGTHLYMLHYLRLWQAGRGKVSLMVFTKEPENIIRLAKILLPNVPVAYPNRFLDHLVNILFGHHFVFFHTLLPVYQHLAAQRPDFPHMFDLAESPHAKYNVFLDPQLSHPSCTSLSSEFIEAYKLVRKQFDYQWPVFTDGCLLNYRTPLPKLQMASILDPLKAKLGIRNPYVVLNVNAKNYLSASARRTIYYPQRYNCLIDFLIEKGYDVVVQGRKEQPTFKPRKGLIDYSKSSNHSIEHDLALYAGCEFVISSKSGVEIFATLCNVPVLGLNYTEILGMQPAKKLRFYPKALQDPTNQRTFSWEEHLSSPHFFEIGVNTYGKEVVYVDMSEDEMREALDEFLPLLALSEEEWTHYTHRQKAFKSKLTPLHMELYLSRGVPCEAYLKRYDLAKR